MIALWIPSQRLVISNIVRTSPFSCRHLTVSISAHASDAKRKSKKTVTAFSELPRYKLDEDGERVGSLDPWREAKLTRKKKAKDGSIAKAIAPDVNDEEADLQAALDEGSIPDSPLAREVFSNWKRFPDSIVLTRVGKFYESYFAPALHLSSLLSLKLAYKRYKTGNYPFSGFPISQLDKYLKILVHDLGNTVVLIEEYPEESHIKGKPGRASVDDEKKNDTDMIVRRVGRVVTPGTLLDETWLNGDESRYLLAIALPENQSRLSTMDDVDNAEEISCPISLAYADVSTGEFFSKDSTLSQMEDELARIAPREVVLDSSLKEFWEKEPGDPTSRLEKNVTDLLSLLRVLGVHVSFANPDSLATLPSIKQLPYAIPAEPPKSLEDIAISLLRHHLQYALRESMPTLPSSPNRQISSAQMQIDAATLHALEIRHALRPGGLNTYGGGQSQGLGPGSSPLSSRGTLLSVLSRAMTPSGHRLLVRTLTAPSTNIKDINSRLSLVQAFVDRGDLRVDLRDMIKDVADVMRIVQRFRGRRGEQREIWDVALWIRFVGKLLERIRQEIIMEHHAAGPSNVQSGDSIEGLDRLNEFLLKFEPLNDLAQLIEKAIDEARVAQASSAMESDEDPDGIEEAGDAIVAMAASSRRSGETRKEEQARFKQEKEEARWWIRPSYSVELQEAHDEMTKLKIEGKEMEEELKKKFNSTSLSLVKGARYGFHVAISKKTEFARIDKSRKFESISEGRSSKTFAYNPWSVLGAKIDQAEEAAFWAQIKAFKELRSTVVDRSEAIQYNAELVDELDLCLSFAQTAVDLSYVRPILEDSTNLNIINGRHPSVESSLLSSARTFTPNSTIMTPNSKLHIITGPNQGGKSTLLRQTAVVAILAQAGSFVPADQAVIGVVDKVFSRIGARDDLFRDRSTFMLEMVETAAILRQATERSLVIMDEIGRGTTLNAGVSIAYATLDYILNKINCRTLFATHYHELGSMLGYDSAKPRERVSFFCTDVDEVDGAFSYSYRLKPGINHDSHAIKAAHLAGMPESFLETAEETLKTLQQHNQILSIEQPASLSTK